uniref:Ig-like domain-containing protein n=1 Tax=Callorhinchus milii TaxID=7868 RepID=A0A4W3HQ11_CALMI
MFSLLLLTVLAALPVLDSQRITELTACTTVRDELRLDCKYTKESSSSTVQYEWTLSQEGKSLQALASDTKRPINNRISVNQTDSMVRLLMKRFVSQLQAGGGGLDCSISLPPTPFSLSPSLSHTDANPICSAPGLLPPWGALLWLAVLQALGGLPYGE